MQERLIVLAIVLISFIGTTVYEIYMHIKYNDFEWRSIVGNTLMALVLSLIYVYGIYPAFK